MSPKQARGAETTRRILDAALAVHAREGQAGFTVAAVAAESGASVGSLYHHFESLDGLAAELYAESLGRLLDELADAVEGSADARDGITAFVRTYLAAAERSPDRMRFVHGAPGSGFVATHAARILERKAPPMERLLRWVAGRVAGGELVELPGPLFEVLIVGPVAELTRRWLAGAPGLDPAEAARVLPERIWSSVRR